MHCKNCNLEIIDDSNFCKQCGYPLKDLSNVNEPYAFRYPTPLRDEVVAVVFSAILPGIGQIYVRKIKRGIGLAISGVILLIICMLTGCMILEGREMSLWYTGTQSPYMLFIPAMLIYSMMLIINVFDVYTLANEYNVTLKKTGSPPW